MTHQFDRPPLQEKEESTPMPWRDHALENLSVEDKQTISKMRDSFKKRGLDGIWSYEAAGLDVMTLFFAPDGVTHRFIDPMYAGAEGKHILSEKINKSWLGSQEGVKNDTQREYVTTELPGDTRIEWIGKSMREAHIDGSIDVAYTNRISPTPSLHTLDHLKQGGILMIEGGAVSHRDHVEHPIFQRSLLDMGFRLIQADIIIADMKLQDVQPLMNYSSSSERKEKNFAVYEKTRDFTDEERGQILLNEKLKDIFYILRSPFYKNNFDPANPEEIDFSKNYLREEMNLFFKELSVLPEAIQESTKEKFQKEMKRRIFDKTPKEILAWVAVIDFQEGKDSITQRIPDGKGQEFLDRFTQQKELVTSILNEYL